jgi:hypothetical protein
MEIVRTRTAQGHGRWGHVEYDVELVTCVQTWWDATRTTQRSVTTSVLVCPDPAGSRSFATDAERQTFIDASFSELVLDPVEPPVSWSEPLSLRAVLGVPMTGVELVHDYVRLTWPDDGLGIYSRSAVVHGDRRWDDDDPEYVHRLRALTGRALTDVDEVLGRGLVLAFDGGTEVEVSLRDAPGRVVEAAEHQGGGRQGGRLWFVGEPPFDA